MSLTQILRRAFIITLMTVTSVSPVFAQFGVGAMEPRPTIRYVTVPRPIELSAEAKQLLAKIREQESAAETFAKEHIRDGSSDPKTLANHKRKLKELLTAIFDLKLQLEELQVKELQSRLGRFERQIRERKEHRDKIVEHRASQLIEKAELEWNSAESNAEGESPTTLATNDPAGDQTRAEPKTEIQQNLQAVLARHFPDAAVHCHELIGGNILMTGEVIDGQTIMAIMDVAQLYAPSIINHLRVNPELSDEKSKSEKTERRLIGKRLTPSTAADNGTATSEQNVVRGETTVSESAAAIAEKIDEPPLLEQMQAKLAPFAERLNAAVNRVRELEGPYFRDRIGAAELKKAMEDFNEARNELRTRYKEYEPLEQQLQNDFNFAKLSSESIETRWEILQQSAQTGTPIEVAAKQILDLRDRTKKQFTDVSQKLIEFQAVMLKVNPHQVRLDEVVPGRSAPSAPIASSNPNRRLDFARAAIEHNLGTKLELVRCDDLNLWFKTALRVSSTRGRYNEGDLIICINGHLFNSWDQAVAAARSTTNGVNVTCLSGGLAGNVAFADAANTFAPLFDLILKAPSSAVFQFEVPIRRPGSDEQEMKYVSGTCLSPEGLVVVPISSKTLVEGEEIAVLGPNKMTARIVASDDEHGLALLKLEGTQPQDIPWLRCRLKMPAKNQQVSVCQRNFIRNHFNTYPGLVVAVGKIDPISIAAKEAFVVDLGGGPLEKLNDGTPAFTQDGDLQGISIQYERRMNADNLETDQYIMLPAVPIEKLLNDYLQTQEK